ncbi:MAG: hypothetical protein QOJ29_4276 [Thermoleophilaceae bacterium]|jgi:hypothetical protein|nr:hypothetical protein [Thermoleophilaceae bacterium]
MSQQLPLTLSARAVKALTYLGSDPLTAAELAEAMWSVPGMHDLARDALDELEAAGYAIATRLALGRFEAVTAWRRRSLR